MNVTVCVKRVPDTETRVQIDGTGIETTGVKFIVSPYDEFAVEAALRTKEAAGDGAVSLLSLGDASTAESLRAGLAMGADSALLLTADVGLDGLATGIVGIAAATFLLYAVRLGDAGVLFEGNPGALLAVLILGICVGFLPHNIHPARIMMGDGGSMLLGLLMAASTVSVGGRTDAPFSGQSFFFFAPLFIPLFILGVPLFDMTFAIVRRIATRGLRVTQADKEHVHHRIMKLGHGHRRAVFILWAWTALLSSFVLWPTYTGEGDAIVPTGIAAVCLLLFTVLHPRLRTARHPVYREGRPRLRIGARGGAEAEGIEERVEDG